MSAASDALMQGLADLSAKLSSSVTDIEAARAEAEVAQAAKDDVTFNAANERVKTMLANLGPHVEAIGQMAGAVAGGVGTSAAAASPAIVPAPDVAPAPAQEPVQADPSSASTDAATETVSASDAPSDEVTPVAEGDASAEEAAATSRRKR